MTCQIVVFRLLIMAWRRIVKPNVKFASRRQSRWRRTGCGIWWSSWEQLGINLRMYSARYFDLGLCIFVFIASLARKRNLGDIRRYCLGLALCRVHLFLVTWSLNRKRLPDKDYCTYCGTAYNVLSPCFCSLHSLLFRCDTTLQYATFLHNPLRTANRSAHIARFSSYIAKLIAFEESS